MTQPTQAQTINGRRIYTNPLRPGNEYPSVTTIISHGVPKNLGNWFKLTTAEYAVQHHDQWSELSEPEAVALIKTASDRVRDHAGNIGDHVHTHLEHLAAGSSPPDLRFACPDAIPSSEQGELFLAEWAPRFHHLEHTVYSERHGYAGSFDFIADLPGLGTVIGDYKTSKGVYSEVGLQLAAYRYADYMLVEQAGQDPLEVPVPEVNSGVVVHIRPDRYQVVPVECGEPMLDRFLAAKTVTDHRQDRTVIGEPLRPPTDIVKLRRRNLERRIATLKTIPGGLERLIERWPVNIPTLKQSDEHTADQLAVIEYRLRDAETEVEAPFDPVDVHPSMQPVGEVIRMPEVVTRRVDYGSPARHRELADRYLTLPADWRASVDQAATLADCPNLLTGKATDGQLDDIDAAITDAERDMLATHTVTQRLLATAVEGDEPLARALRECAQFELTKLGHERLQAVAAAVNGPGFGMGNAGDHGEDVWEVTVTPGLPVLLTKQVGGKSDVNKAAKTIGARHGLDVPRSADKVAEDPLLAALVLYTNSEADS